MSALLSGLKKVSLGGGSKGDVKAPSTKSTKSENTETHSSADPLDTNATTNGDHAPTSPVASSPTDFWNGTARLGCLTESQEKALYEFWNKLLVDHVPPDHHLRTQLICSMQDGEADGFILRFLRARKFDVKLAIEALVNTLAWRDDPNGGNVEEIIQKGDSDLDPGLFNGRALFVGYDHDNHIVSYHSASHHVRGVYPEVALQKLTIYMMETGRLFLKKGTKEEVTLLFDMSKFGMANMDQTLMKYMVRCMTDHYPESLGRCLVLDAPWVFSSVWKVIKTWLDPVVASKVRFIKISELEDYIPRKAWPVELAEYYVRNVEKGEKRKEPEFVESEEPVEEVDDSGNDSNAASTTASGQSSPKQGQVSPNASHAKSGPTSNIKSGLKSLRKSVSGKKEKLLGSNHESEELEAPSRTQSEHTSNPLGSPRPEKSISNLELHLPDDHFELVYSPPSPDFTESWFNPERSARITELRSELVDIGERFLNLTYTWASLGVKEGKSDPEVKQMRKEVRANMVKKYKEFDNTRRFPTAWHRAGVIKGDRVQFPKLPNDVLREEEESKGVKAVIRNVIDEYLRPETFSDKEDSAINDAAKEEDAAEKLKT